MIKKAILSFALVLAVAVGAFTMFHKAFNAFAQSGTHYISGYGWSSNYGWISFDCADLSYCGTANYKVSIDSAGNLSGYAWVNPRDTVSGVNNVGWLQFGGLSGFPTTDSNTTATNAKIVTAGTSKSMVGWARFCSGGATPTSCSGGAGTNTGGWDGWVSFSGTNHGISLSNLDSPVGSGNYPFTGYAWGGDWVDNNANGAMDSTSTPSEVIGPGWIDLSKAIAHLDPSNNDASMQLYGNGQPVPASAMTGVLTLNLNVAETLALTWDTFHMSSCTASSNDLPYWTGAKAAGDTTPGSPHAYLPVRTYTAPGVFFYLLTCTKNPAYGPTGTIVQEVVVNVKTPTPPHFEFFGNGTQVDPATGNTTINLNVGQPLFLTWNTYHLKYPIKTCTATGTGVNWSGFRSVASDGTSATGFWNSEPVKVVIVPGTYTYTLTCLPDPAYSTAALPPQTITTIITNPATPLVVLNAIASPQTNTNSYNWDGVTSQLIPQPATPTLTWWGQNLDMTQACTASVVPNPLLTLTNGGLPGWDNSTSPASTATSATPSSKVVSTPPINPAPGPAMVRYMISCKATNGTTVTDTADIGIKDVIPALDLSLTANPSTVVGPAFKTTLKYSTISSQYKDCSGTAADDATGTAATAAQIPIWVDPGAPSAPTWNKPAPTSTTMITIPNVSVPFAETRFAITCRDLNNPLNMMTATTLVKRDVAQPVINLRFDDGSTNHIYTVGTTTASLEWNTSTNTQFSSCTGAFGLADWNGVSQSPVPPTSGAFTSPVPRSINGTAGSVTTFALTCNPTAGGAPVDSNTITALIQIPDDDPQVDLGGNLTGGIVYNYNTSPYSPLVLSGPGPVHLQWIPKDVQSCVASYTTAGGGTVTPVWAGQKNPNNGTYAAGPFTITKSTTFRIDCFPATGSPVHDIVFTCVDDAGSCTTVNPPTGAKKPKFIEF